MGFRIIRFFIYFFLLNAIAFTGIFIADMDTLQRYIHFDYMRMASAIIRSIISLTHLRIACFLFKRFKDIPTWLKIVLAVLSFFVGIAAAGFLLSVYFPSSFN